MKGNARSVLVWFIAGLALLASLCLLLSPSAVSPPVAHAQVDGLCTPQNISDTQSKSWLPDIAVDSSGQLHVVWAEYPGNQEAGQWGDAIFYTMWNGTTWSNPSDILVIPNGFSHVPAIAVDSKGLLHVTWTDTKDIYYSHAWAQGSPWSAASWSPPAVISGGGLTNFSDVAVDSQDNIHVVWVEASLDNNLIEGELCPLCNEIYYARSGDGGSSWSAPLNISNTLERDSRPRLLIDVHDHLHVVWDRGDIRDHGLGLGYVRSVDGGASWSESLNLNADVGAERPSKPTLAADSQGRVHVMWLGIQESRSVVFHRWSEDNGLTWTVSEVFPFHLIDYSGYGVQQVFDPDDRLHIVFSARSEDSPIYDAYYAFWDGDTWSLPVNISSSQQRSVVGRIVMRLGNEVHAVWYEHPLGVDPLVTTDVQMDVFHNCIRLSRSSFPPVALPTLPTPTWTPTPVYSTTLMPTATAQEVQMADLPSGTSVGSGSASVLVIPILLVIGVLGLVILVRMIALHGYGSRR